jgi:thymidylate kinase
MSEEVTWETRPAGEGDPISLGAEVAAAIDDVVEGPVLVVGSPPPGGRDLDLLAKLDDYATIRAWLDHAGFVPWRHTWARFEQPGLYAVELSTAERWQTKRQDASCLFIDAEPIPGLRHLVSPGPATVLLLAARGTVIRRGRITEKVRRRISNALERDPCAWLLAERRARDLGMVGPLALLREAYQASDPLSWKARAAGLSGVLLRQGPLEAKARILVESRPRRIRPPIVSFSGLDGSGKSTQVSQLQDHLRQLGVSSERQWAGFKSARKVRAAVPLLDRPRGADRGAAPRPNDRLVPTALLDSPRGRKAWVFVVAGVNAFHLWSLVLRRRRGTAVLIFDRFTPDSTVKLDLHFLRSRGIDIRWQRRLFSLISPKPDVGFLVEVPDEIAHSRRQEESLEQLSTMSELYQEQVARYRLRRLDGTEDPQVLARHVAIAAWRGLA